MHATPKSVSDPVRVAPATACPLAAAPVRSPRTAGEVGGDLGAVALDDGRRARRGRRAPAGAERSASSPPRDLPRRGARPRPRRSGVRPARARRARPRPAALGQDGRDRGAERRRRVRPGRGRLDQGRRARGDRARSLGHRSVPPVRPERCRSLPGRRRQGGMVPARRRSALRRRRPRRRGDGACRPTRRGPRRGGPLVRAGRRVCSPPCCTAAPSRAGRWPTRCAWSTATMPSR